MRLLSALAAVAAGTAAVLAGLAGADAQSDYPNRAITIYVPFAAGGGADPVARSVAEAIQQGLGQPAVVEFRKGANGTIGAKLVADAKPDGYTLLVTSPAPLVNVKFSKDTPYDPETAFQPIAQIADAPYLFVASAKFGPKTFKEFVAYAKANPGKVNSGVSGLGGLAHLATVILSDAAGIELTPVPYGGVGERIADLMAGVIDTSNGIGASGFLPGIQDGSIIPLVVMGETKLPETPNVPTTVELGYPTALASGWYVLAAPAKTPREIVDKLNRVVVEYLQRPKTQEAFIKFGNMVKTGTPEEAKALIDRDTEQLRKLIEAGKFKVE